MPTRRPRLLSYMVGGFPLSLFECIAEAIDADLDYDETRSGPAPGDDPFADGRADFGWICSTSFVDLSLRSPVPTVNLAGIGWVPIDSDAHGRPVYFGDVVVRPESPIGSIEEVEGATIGCNDRVSLSGHYALRIALRRAGHDLDTFADLRFTGGHNISLDALADGHLDVAVVDSVVRTSRARSDARIAKLRVVERLGPWPVQPLVASARLSPEQVARARHALLASNTDVQMQAELRAASLARFVEVGDAHYHPISEALSEL